MQKSALVVTLLIVGLLFMRFVWHAPSASQYETPDFARKVNLALRRTVHRLLIEKGDSTSQIPAVQRPNAATYVIRLEHPFEYGRLPALLQQSLAIHAIKDNYDVAVLDCTNGELQLGYSLLDVTESNTVPCQDREQKQGCCTLQLSFMPQESGLLPITPVWWVCAMSFLLIGGAYIAWQTVAEKRTLPSATLIQASDSLISIGKLSFSPVNQAVSIAGTTYPLTYREAKLLHLFVCHPNQLLTRDFILKAVWEDEGIIVGRSADVFVSRLRKLLRPDPTLQLVAVHGVGYRLEVAV